MTTTAKPRRRKTVDDIDAEIARLKEQRREVRQKSAERFSRIALETGLADLSLTDEEIETAFQEFAGRFQGKRDQRNGSPRQADPTAAPEREAAGADARA
jgi:hypothetical protein